MNILIISENRHNTAGGIEKYNNNLITIFTNMGHKVDEFSFHFTPEKPEIFAPNKNLSSILNPPLPSKKISLIHRLFLISKFKKRILEIEDKYDIIINSTANIAWPKNIYKSKKWIFVQHFNKNFYLQKYIAGSLLAPFIYFGMNLFGIKNPFKKFQNIVFFTQEDEKDFIKKNEKPIRNFFHIPIGVYTQKEIDDISQKINYAKKTENFIYFGRINNYQKRIKLINKIFNKSKNKIDIFGDGSDKKYLPPSNYVSYKGSYDHHDLLEILDKYKFSLLFSKFEGFPISIVESLSNGIPVISTLSSKSIKWLVDNHGVVINNDKQIIDNLNEIKKMSIDDYQQLSRKCFEFASQYLSIEAFSTKWIEVINKVNLLSKDNNKKDINY